MCRRRTPNRTSVCPVHWAHRCRPPFHAAMAMRSHRKVDNETGNGAPVHDAACLQSPGWGRSSPAVPCEPLLRLSCHRPPPSSTAARSCRTSTNGVPGRFRRTSRRSSGQELSGRKAHPDRADCAARRALACHQRDQGNPVSFGRIPGMPNLSNMLMKRRHKTAPGLKMAFLMALVCL